VTEAAPATENRFTVLVASGDQGWEVAIVDPAGKPVWARACGSESEARTLASTIRQHVYWLSEPKFRQYYRLDEAAG
jgi:hypothetical protein